MSESNAVRANTMFGDYDIIETVGQGGMGIVYRATDTNLNREVALKVLKDDLREHPSVVARFQREAEAIATLNHPNIVHIYSVGAVGKIPYIAMQMIHGTPLSKLMKKERRLPWKRALQIGIQVAEALGSAHEEHIIHRDIKPGNILIGTDEHAFVTDFGIAKVLTAETQLTVEGSRLGTPQYMSPERCKNEDVTASSDLYSLGVLLFQMITGRLPYEAKDPIRLISQIVSEPPHRMTDFLPDVPEDVERLIAFLIEKKVVDRPQSAAEWIGLCQRVIDGKPMIEDDSGLEESLRQFREAQATPTPTPAPIGAPYKKPKTQSSAEKLAKRFRGISPNRLTAGASLLAVIVFGLLGMMIATSGKPDSAAGIALALGDINTDWRNAESIAYYRSETPGVSLIEMSNRDLSAVPVALAPGGEVLVTLEGSTGSAWAARRGLMWLEPEERAAHMAVSPIPLEGVTFIGPRPGAGAALVDVEGQWYAVGPDAAPVRESVYSVLGRHANERFANVTQLQWTGGGAVVMAHDAVTNSQGLYHFAPGSEVSNPLVGNRGIAGSLTVINDSAALWTEGQSGRSHTLYLLEAFTAGSASLQLIEEMPASDRFDVHPAQDQLCGVRLKAGGGTEAVIIDLDRPTIARRVVDALDVRWTPSGEALVVLAPDRKDVPQIWRVEASEPYQSRQLTFLEEGVASLGIRAGNRLIAVGGSTAQPALVEIDFEHTP